MINRIFIIFLAATATVIFSFPAASEARSNNGREKIKRSVVKIFATYRRPNYYQPWQYKSQESSIGSGVIMEDRRILTNAHIVNNAVFLEVKKSSDPKRYIAKVEAVGHRQDLAIITVKDADFFRGTDSLAFGELPDLLDQVSVYGYPRGGSEISITQGVVSRIEQTRYAHSGIRILGVQIDAAINPGNSGGPVVRNGKLAGVAMQALSSGENIGYLIPTPVIKHFLKDIAEGPYEGYPDDGLSIQLAENEALRSYYKMGKHQTGVIVTDVIYGSSSYGILQKGDVITAVDSISIANDATVKLDKNKRLGADYVIQKHQVGESMTVDIIRDGEAMRIDVPLKKPVRLVERLFDQRPRYIIFGGLVFTTLTMNYLKEWGRNWYRKAPSSLMHYADNPYPTKERSEVVVMRNALAHDVNAGYHNFYNKIVAKVNGQHIGSMEELKAAFDKSDGKYTIIEFEKGEEVVIDNAAAKTSEPEIMERYGIAATASAELR